MWRRDCRSCALIEEIKPKEAEFHMVLGDGWKASGKDGRCRGRVSAGVADRTRLVRALRALAAVEKKDDAEKILARAVQIAPDDAESWFR